MITINNVKMPLDSTQSDIKAKVAELLRAKVTDIKILKRAIDARKKGEICFVYNIEVSIKGDEVAVVKKCNDKNIFISRQEAYVPPICEKASSKSKVIIVGSGPAGLFCAYILAKAGLEPLLIERGKTVDERKHDVELFRNSGILNTESNIQFGEGGAGTFSDGKLNTGIKDVRIRYVLETFAAAANGSRGTAVEFQVSTNVDRDENDVGRGDRAAAYKLIDGGYVPRTAGTRAAPGGVPAPVFETPLAAGTLHERYYMPGKNGDYLYKNDTGDYCAYAGTDAFPEGFYMGMAVRLEFTVYSWMPRKTTDPVRVTALDVKVEVYASEQDAENGAAPLHSRRAILDLADAPRLVQGSSPAAAA